MENKTEILRKNHFVVRRYSKRYCFEQSYDKRNGDILDVYI